LALAANNGRTVFTVTEDAMQLTLANHLKLLTEITCYVFLLIFKNGMIRLVCATDISVTTASGE
jgi:hypothetical protein